MKQTSLRAWVLTVFIALLVYQVYIMSGSLMPQIAKSTGVSLDTLRTVFADVSFLAYCVVVFGWLMCGVHLYCNTPANRLTRYCGGVLVAYAAIVFCWELTVVIGRHISVKLIPPPTYAVLVIVSGILLCAALILIAVNYHRKKLLVWSIVYAVLHCLYMILHLMARFQTSTNYHLLSISGICAALGLIALWVYLYQWAKMLKETV